MERKDPQVSCVDEISSYDQTLLSVVCMAEEALPSRRTSLSTSRSRNRVRLGPIFNRSSSPAATYLSIVERDTRSRSEASRRVIKMSSERRRGKTELMTRLSKQPLMGLTMMLGFVWFYGRSRVQQSFCLTPWKMVRWSYKIFGTVSINSFQNVSRTRTTISRYF